MKMNSFKITVESTIENIGGETETTKTTADGLVSAHGRGIRLAYSESGEGGEVSTTVNLLGSTVTVTRHGALESKLVFREGDTTESIYSVGAYRFDASVTTRRIRNSLTECGGTLTLYYSMTVGGAEKSVRMKIVAEEKLTSDR